MADNTSFSIVYDAFLGKITDDMYMELFPDETNALLQELMLTAIPWFEFPKVDISDYDLENEVFNVELTNEEVNIIATYMVVAWMGSQLASIDNIRQKYSGSDFKFTSQAAHIEKLKSLRDSYKEEGHHLQRLYKRRTKTSDGRIVSTFGQLREVS